MDELIYEYKRMQHYKEHKSGERLCNIRNKKAGELGQGGDTIVGG
jgi:hypothetical protein